jgi:hypothetical protein
MKTAVLIGTTLIFCVATAAGQAKLLTNDPLTGLLLMPATDSGRHFNQPVRMPDGSICKCQMQGDFYSLYNTKVDAAVAWYSSHLAGFKQVRGYESRRSQVAFYNPDRTVVVIVTGVPGAEGENTNAYSVAYERYQPGLAEKTVTSLTRGKIVCR